MSISARERPELPFFIIPNKLFVKIAIFVSGVPYLSGQIRYKSDILGIK